MKLRASNFNTSPGSSPKTKTRGTFEEFRCCFPRTSKTSRVCGGGVAERMSQFRAATVHTIPYLSILLAVSIFVETQDWCMRSGDTFPAQMLPFQPCTEVACRLIPTASWQTSWQDGPYPRVIRVACCNLNLHIYI